MVYSGNRYLTMAEMRVNAEYIFAYLTRKGWSKNAICGVLGNMQTESTINPSIWQSLKQGNMSGGYGLVQWTPATKYIDWCSENGLIYFEIDSNLERILYEVENNLQWIHPTMKFREFTISNKSPYDLAMLFLKHYERPKEPNQPVRGNQANYWFSTLVGGNPGGVSPPVFPTTDGLTITSPYGWRFHPIHNEDRFHGAIDIGGGGVNHPIYATQSGEVIDNYFSNSGGYVLVLKHTRDSYYSQYMHLAERPSLNVGDKVEKGQTIAIMGTTGDSTGIHLHFAIATSPNGFGTEEGTIDPELYLNMEFEDLDPLDPKKKKSKIFLFLPKRRFYC